MGAFFSSERPVPMRLRYEWVTDIHRVTVRTTVASVFVMRGFTNSVTVDLVADPSTHEYVKRALRDEGEVSLELEQPGLVRATVTVVTADEGCNVDYRGSSGSLYVYHLHTGIIGAYTMTGSMTFLQCNLRIDAETTLGDIDSFFCQGSTNAMTASGNVTFHTCSGQMRGQTISGLVLFNGCSGKMAAGSVSGRVRTSTCGNAVRPLESEHAYDHELPE